MTVNMIEAYEKNIFEMNMNPAQKSIMTNAIFIILVLIHIIIF